MLTITLCTTAKVAHAIKPILSTVLITHNMLPITAADIHGDFTAIELCPAVDAEVCVTITAGIIKTTVILPTTHMDVIASLTKYRYPKTAITVEPSKHNPKHSHVGFTVPGEELCCILELIGSYNNNARKHGHMVEVNKKIELGFEAHNLKLRFKGHEHDLPEIFSFVGDEEVMTALLGKGGLDAKHGFELTVKDGNIVNVVRDVANKREVIKVGKIITEFIHKHHGIKHAAKAIISPAHKYHYLLRSSKL
ncbi:Protein of unknown function [Pyronema omphalodes CBS 100304]|uniref:Uncharacterized protein n=1 Tax=Pyronema omphalodes (strain CBS 100304) TaxID=1076935 RepID=U4L605_PYROM|nr:Protein of unknown function [Pyronema omphalodes CBS 100304]